MFTDQQALEKGDKTQVGSNVHTATGAEVLEIPRISHQTEVDKREVLTERKATSENAEVRRWLADMGQAARGNANMLRATKSEATLDEIRRVF